MLAYAGICYRMLAYARKLAHGEICWHVKADASIGQHMPADPRICDHMLAYASIYLYQQMLACASLFWHWLA